MERDRRVTWERYVASWKTPEAAEKKRIFAECLAEDCVYTDPLVRTEGWNQLLSYMTDFQKQVPGGHFTTEQFIAHHGKSMARWKMRGADDAVLGDGVSYGEYDDEGRLTAMTGFYEVPSSGE